MTLKMLPGKKVLLNKIDKISSSSIKSLVLGIGKRLKEALTLLITVSYKVRELK